MEGPMIQVGGSLDEKAVKTLADSICRVMDSAFKNHADQETMRQAVAALSNGVAVEHTTITNSVFTGDKNVA